LNINPDPVDCGSDKGSGGTVSYCSAHGSIAPVVESAAAIQAIGSGRARRQIARRKGVIGPLRADQFLMLAGPRRRAPAR